MMRVEISSRSVGKATKTVRRILDRYLFRSGGDTWSGPLSSEGLKEVETALRKKVSPRMSVCIRTDMKSSSPVFVGRRSPFSEDGHVPVSASGRRLPMRDRMPKTRDMTILSEAVCLAGLLHDVGKATSHFQSRLAASVEGRTDRQRDILRHEFLSLLAVDALDRCAQEGKPTMKAPRNSDAKNPGQHGHADGHADTIFLERLSVLSGADIREAMGASMGSKALARMGLKKTRGGRISVIDADSLSQHPVETIIPGRPVLSAVRYLIMSHHRLPELQDMVSGPRASRFVNLSDVAQDYSLCSGFCDGSNGEDDTLLLRIRNSASRLLEAIRGVPVPDMTEGLLHYGRLSLMLADHEVSGKGFRYTKDLLPVCPVGPWANTDQPKGLDARAFKQGLAAHLKAVGATARMVNRSLFALGQQMPGLKVLDLPESFFEGQTGRFEWQARAVSAAKTVRTDAGFIGVVCGSTGSGKTKACMSIAVALSNPDRIRLTVCLGLRNLTLQTGDAYEKEIGIPSAKMGVRIGSSVHATLHHYTADDVSDGEVGRIERLQGAVDYDDRMSSLALRLSGGGGRGKCNEAYVGVPILVATTDGLRGVMGRESGLLHHSLRVMTSDLILDEIDDYSAEDQAALISLVEAAGSYGRRVLISSATTPPATACAMYAAYRRGYSRYARFSGGVDRVDYGFFSDAPNSCQVIRDITVQDFPGAHADCAQAVLHHILATEGRRSLKIVHTADLANLTEVYEKIGDAAFELHHGNAVTLDSGQTFSAGLVRLNNTRRVRELAEHLSQKSSADLHVAVLCYHSRFMLASRFRIEAFLNRVCNRKNRRLSVDRMPEMAKVIREARGRDICLLVVATPIAEVGRDNDYDFLVTEPCSYRSLVQATGRVRRHRPERYESVNVAMLDVPLRWHANRALGRNVENPDKDKYFPSYIRPGVEEHGVRLNSRLAQRIFNAGQLEESIDARHSIRVPDHHECHIAALEHEVLERELTERLDVDDAVGLTDFIPKTYPFRSTEDDVTYYLKDGIWFAEHGRQEYKRNSAVRMTACEGSFALDLGPDDISLVQAMVPGLSWAERELSSVSLPIYGQNGDIPHLVYDGRTGGDVLIDEG